tara:strand:+ start:358 stop:576 length:219 start_codon:yes stop_codon:yes gene_type:complete
MGYAMAMGSCYGCGQMMTFNPHKVPSVRDPQGIRQAICKSCVKVVQNNQKRDGLPIAQIPKNAYEPIHESEL